ncbi:MAG TPA: Gfo/Idh/MocA family oxidoreductase [Tepidisphaeraceae bacterium]|nr:Gfo/Idh/MocA family oxidoreductase [Tepidisphaeraceae bacterium]
MNKMHAGVSRREFGKTALGAAVAAMSAPAFLRGQNLNSRLNIACIGSGGRGGADAEAVSSENIVALVDVNRHSLDSAARKYPKAKQFDDFRKLFDIEKEFDAVTVATCEHTHALATMLALRHDKHIYCEKPLTHDIWEARQIREYAATKKKLALQMGIQIHASENYHRVVELIQAGVIGKVHEAHVWVSRAWGLQSEDAAKRNRDIVYVTQRPTEEKPVPDYLNWDLWLGPAASRPFSDVYVPGPKWYRWWDFGNGTMSDLGSHFNDLPFWALKLDAPLTVEASGPPAHPDIAPASMSVTYEYGQRGDLPPVKFHWHQGEAKPQIWKDKGIPQWPDGHLFIGDKGMLLSNYGKHLLLPEAQFKDVKLPDPTLPRSPEHHKQWIDACKSGGPTTANFDYSGWLTEANHLGNVAYRVGRKIHWDAKAMRAPDAPEADRFIKCERRKGWEL